MLAPRHFRFTQVTLNDQTDRQNELVHEQEWLPLQDGFDVSGNLFSIEDPLTGDGLVFLKLAPLPHARPVKNPWDARVAGGNRRVLFAGHGYPVGAARLLRRPAGTHRRAAGLSTLPADLRSRSRRAVSQQHLGRSIEGLARQRGIPAAGNRSRRAARRGRRAGGRRLAEGPVRKLRLRQGRVGAFLLRGSRISGRPTRSVSPTA